MIDIGPNLAACLHWVCFSVFIVTCGSVLIVGFIADCAREIGDAAATVIRAIRGGAK